MNSITLMEELSAFSSKRTLMGDAASQDAPPETLFDMLKSDAVAPSSTAVAVIPMKDGKSTLNQDDLQKLADIQMLTSFVSVASMRRLYQTTYKDVPPDITTGAGAASFVANVANAKNFILTSALAGFLSLDSTTASNFDQSTTSADLHLGFLTSLFDSFSFPPATIKELDGVLSSVRETLDNLKLSWSDQTSTLDHMIFLYYFDPVPGLEDVKVAKMRLYFLHITQSSWTAAVGKSSVSHIDFHMNFSDSVYDMDPAAVDAQRDKIKELLKALSGQDLDTLNELLSPKVVKNETA